MTEQFLQQLKHLKVSKRTKMLLAVSGGVDSMTLAHLLNKNGYSFSIAHCNFALRGEESDLDQTFIKNISRLNKIQFFIKKFNTVEYAEKNKMSIQKKWNMTHVELV